MKIGRGMMFHAACALSLLLAAAMVWLWVESFRGEFHHLSFAKSDGRYTLRSKWGQFLWCGPPRDGEDEKWLAQIAQSVSNEDFEWRRISTDYVEGTVRKGTPTREMWDANWRLRQREEPYGRLMDESLINARARLFLAAMEDQRKTLPAHLMLLCAAEEKRQEYFQRRQPWREASFLRESSDAPEEPVLFMRSDASGKSPDLTSTMTLRQEWHDVLDTPRWAIFHGWVLAPAMVMPLARLTRPWRMSFTSGSWLFNWVALVSAVVCVATSVMWVRSLSIDEQWKFASFPCQASGKWNYAMSTHSWIGSSKGMFIWRATDLPDAKWVGVKSAGWGYEKTITAGPSLPTNMMAAASGERKLDLPGFGFHVMPPQLVTATIPASFQPIPVGPRGNTMFVPARTSTTLIGFRVLSIRWWLLVMLSAIAPCIWARNAAGRWRRIREGKKVAAVICLNCGYDIRATPQRCPECGNEPETKTMKPVAS